jgi:tol-pal system protein YbgF
MKKALVIALMTAGFASSPVSAANHSASANSELVLLIQQLQAEVRQLRGEIETQQYRLQNLEKDQLDRYRDVDRRLSALILQQGDSPISAPSDSVASDSPSVTGVTDTSVTEQTITDQLIGQSVVDQPVVAQQPVQPEPVPVPTVDDKTAYQNAFGLVRERKFDEAITAFQEFIRFYPESDNLANAYYWIGEVKLAQQELEAAQLAFESVVSQFPAHRKRPDALYKLGVVKDRRGDATGQALAFQMLLDEYPTSSAAGLARNYKPR